MCFERLATSAAGTATSDRNPRSTEKRARSFRERGALLLPVRTANGGGWDRSADHACDGNQRQDVGQGLEEGSGSAGVDGKPEGECGRETEQERGAKGTEWTPVAEDQASEGDEPTATGHVLGEGADEPVRQVHAAKRGEHSGEHNGAVPDRVDVDADGVGRPRVLSAGADPKADRRLEHDDVGEGNEQEREPDQQV